MPLAAETGTFLISGGGTGAALRAETGLFSINGTASFTREYAVDLGNLSLRLEDLQRRTSYFDPEGRPTAQMQIFWQRRREAIEIAFDRLRLSVVAIQTAYDAAAQAQTAAAVATSTVAAVQDTVEQAQQIVTDLQSGELNLDTVQIGGTRFANNGGTLVAIP